MIQSEILQTHAAWLLLSTPVIAACSALLILDTESSPTPWAIHEAASTGQVRTAQACALGLSTFCPLAQLCQSPPSVPAPLLLGSAVTSPGLQVLTHILS